MQVFMYDTGSGWLPSDIYTWPDMIQVLMEPSKWGCAGFSQLEDLGEMDSNLM